MLELSGLNCAGHFCFFTGVCNADLHALALWYVMNSPKPIRFNIYFVFCMLKKCHEITTESWSRTLNKMFDRACLVSGFLFSCALRILEESSTGDNVRTLSMFSLSCRDKGLSSI